MTGYDHNPNLDPLTRSLPQRVIQLGCVRYLNTRPLIQGLHDDPAVQLHSDVPGLMKQRLIGREVDAALCPVIDFVTSEVPLVMLPDAGGIGCDGPTLTVRLLSRVPWNQVSQLQADTDSHTSVVLSRIILAGVHGVQPQVNPWTPPSDGAPQTSDWPDTILLIGDKVITSHVTLSQYPWQMDLGQAWKQYTGMPFVFAVWMAHADLPASELAWIAARLQAARLAGLEQVNELAARYAPQHDWPIELARHYLGHLLKYNLTREARAAIGRFWHEAYQLGIIAHVPEARWFELPQPEDAAARGGPSTGATGTTGTTGTTRATGGSTAAAASTSASKAADPS